MSSEDPRGVEEERQVMGPNEELIFTLDVRKVGVGSAPSNADMKVYTDGVEVTGDVLEGGFSYAGTIITLKKVKSLTLGEIYRVVVHYDQESSRPSNFFYIMCTEPD